MKNFLLSLFINLVVSIAAFSQIPGYASTNGLVAWFPMNGNTNDLSGSGNHGSASGATLTKDRFDKPNSAYAFRGFGSKDHIKIPNSSSLQFKSGFTISLWYKDIPGNSMNGNGALSANGTSVLFAKEGDGIGTPPGFFAEITYDKEIDYLGYYNTNGCCEARDKQNNLALFSHVTGLTSQWKHFVLVATDKEYKIYLNGSLVKTKSLERDFSGANNQDLYFGIMGSGKDSDPFWYPYNGQLDDIGIWNRVLNPNEISKLYTPAQERCGAKIVSTGSSEICKGESLTLTANSNLPSAQVQTEVNTLVNSGLWSLLVKYNNHYYLQYKTRMMWPQAKILCEQNGGYMYCVNSQMENNNVSVPIANSQAFGDFLLGLYQDSNDPNYFEPSGGWKWLDGSALSYTNWASIDRGWIQNEPSGGSENFGIMDWSNTGSYWNDIDGNIKGTVIMEYTGNTTYLWSNGSTNASLTLTPDANTVYYVTVTAGTTVCIDSILVKVTDCCKPDNFTTDKLVAAWPFCGNMLDASGNKHHGKIKEGNELYTMDRHNKENNAFFMDGKTYIEIPHNEAFNQFPFSVSAWVKSNQINSGHIVNKYYAAAWNGWALYSGDARDAEDAGDAGSGWYLRSRTDAMISQYDDYPLFETQGKTNDGKWHLITFTVDSSSGYIYLDGVLQDTQSWRGQSGKCTSNFPVRIGFYAGDNIYFNGAIDDIGVWGRKLSSEEIKKIYDLQPIEDQFTLKMDTISASVGQIVDVTIKTKNFKEIISAQFSLQFDPSMLEFAGFSGVALGTLSDDNFGLSQLSSGKIGFAWNSLNLNPITLADGSVAMKIRFKTLGGGKEFSDVRFTNDPISVEFSDKNLKTLTSPLLCPGRVNILYYVSVAGKLATESGKGIPAATIRAVGPDTLNTLSAQDGTYSMILSKNKSYTITPSKANDSINTNGITVTDALRIRKHILRNELLQSPYKIIAADINGSGTITSADVNQVLALIQGNISNYTTGKLWRFVPANHMFSNLTNPFPFPESAFITTVNNITTQNFIGMKLGDVDDTYNPVHNRSVTDTVSFYIKNQQVINENIIKVPVYTKGFKDVAAFQFSIQWDPSKLSYIGIGSQYINLDMNAGVSNVVNGQLNLVWLEALAKGYSVADGESLFYLTFEVKGKARSSTDVMIYSSPTTPIEVATSDFKLLKYNLEKGKISFSSLSSLTDQLPDKTIISASPNPFVLNTNISIISSISKSCDLSWYNSVGILMGKQRIQLNNGTTVLTLDDINQPGVYYVILSDLNTLPLASKMIIKI
jgi:hypothetical protein